MSIGPLLALLSRLTNARANNLDRLDANIASRASATHYTESRAQKIDSIDATVSSRASQDSVDNILGTGFDVNTDSLPAVRDQLNNMAGSGFNSADDSLKILSDKLDQVVAGMVNHTISNSDPSGGNDGDIWFKI